MNYKPLLVKEAIGATKRMGIVLGLLSALTVSISLFHVLRELQGLPYDGGPLYDTYATFYEGTVTFLAGTFVVMSICFCLHHALVNNRQKMLFWLVVTSVIAGLSCFWL